MRVKTRQLNLRRALVGIVLVIVVIAFGARLVDVQILSAATYSTDAKDKRAVPVVLQSNRGDIVDRNGNVLATTEQRYDVQLSPKNTLSNGGFFQRQKANDPSQYELVSTAEAYTEIGAVTGQRPEEIEKIVADALKKNKDSDFAYVKREIDLTELNALKALQIPWLTFAVHQTRTYPNGAVAGNIVGFVGAEEKPQAGIEFSQNPCLQGKDGSEQYERGEDGVALPGSTVITKKAVDGGTVKLTIDRDLQWEAQQIINRKVQEVSAESGYLVIMDSKTGELLAVAEDGSVDPNDINASDPEKLEARAFVSPYEPGSTFKIITAAALIDQGAATPLTENPTPDYWEPEPGVRFGDAFPHPTIQWTLAGILTQSSNVGTAMVGSRLSPEIRYEYLRKFGIGTSTQAGMPLEDSGLLYPVNKWDPQTSYNTMFGQGVSSTIIQTAGVYQTIANGGVRVPPSIVSACVSSSGKTTQPDHGASVRVVSPETNEQLMALLGTVGASGWFKDIIAIPGYRVAGKTGTAEQSDGQGGYRTDYVHSFAGIFPADNPQYVIVASVAFPKTGDGSAAALTSFHDAAEATIRTFHIPPSHEEFVPYPTEY